MKLVYKTKGTCSTNIELTIENNTLKEVFFWGGCNGNLKAISKLVENMPVDEVIAKLDGIRCGSRSTSCADQLCQALKSCASSTQE